MTPLQIRYDSVGVLARTVMKVIGARNKTEAFARPCKHVLRRCRKMSPLERIRDVRTRADEIGAPDPTFDMKTSTDD